MTDWSWASEIAPTLETSRTPFVPVADLRTTVDSAPAGRGPSSISSMTSLPATKLLSEAIKPCPACAMLATARGPLCSNSFNKNCLDGIRRTNCASEPSSPKSQLSAGCCINCIVNKPGQNFSASFCHGSSKSCAIPETAEVLPTITWQAVRSSSPLS